MEVFRRYASLKLGHLPHATEAEAKEAMGRAIALRKNGEIEQAREAYEAALDAGLRTLTAQGQVHGAWAAYSLGLLLDDEDKVREADGMQCEAFALGKMSNTPFGLGAAAAAAVQLLFIGIRVGRLPSVEGTLLAQAIELARSTGKPDAVCSVCEAATAVGNHRLSLGDAARALVVLQEAVKMIKGVDGSEAKEVAAKASMGLGRVHAQLGSHNAVSAYKEAALFGREAGTPEGFATAASAGLELGNLLNIADDGERRRSLYDAIEMGRQSELPEGLEAAAKAAMDLTRMSSSQTPGERFRGIREAVRTGGNSGTAGDEEYRLLREAVNLGRASGTQAGHLAATEASNVIEIVRTVTR